MVRYTVDYMLKSITTCVSIAQEALQSIAIGVSLALALVGCAVTQNTSQRIAIARTDSVALLPIANHTDVPQAGLRAESIIEASLRARGLLQLQMYPIALNPETLFEPSERKAQAEAEKWAKTQNIRYVVYGAVDEWRYKVGVDGEPAVGLVLQLIGGIEVAKP